MPPTPPRPAAPVHTLPDDAPTGSGRWIGWTVYGVLVLLGFCFGVWSGNQRPKPVEVANAATPTKEPAPTPEPAPKKAPTPAASPEPKAPEAKAPEAKSPEPKMPEATAPEPKPPVVKKPEPKPEPKPAPAVAQVSFDKEVRPVFKAKCTICHGDTKGPKNGLDLRTLAATLKGGDNGPGAKPADPKNSTVWMTIDDGTMPPAGKEQLTDAEKKLIHDWILGGAK